MIIGFGERAPSSVCVKCDRPFTWSTSNLERKTVRIMIEIPKELNDTLDQFKRLQHVSKGEITEAALREFLRYGMESIVRCFRTTGDPDQTVSRFAHQWRPCAVFI